MKRSMGLDIGTRTIGVATSDLLGMIAGRRGNHTPYNGRTRF